LQTTQRKTFLSSEFSIIIQDIIIMPGP